MVVAFMTEPIPVSAQAAESTVSWTMPVNASFAALLTVPTGSHTAPTGPQSHGLIGLACACLGLRRAQQHGRCQHPD